MIMHAEKSKPRTAHSAVSSPSLSPEKTKFPAQRREAERKRALSRRPLLASAPPSTDWLRPPTLPNAVGLTQRIYSNARLTQKHWHRHTQNTVQPTVWVPSGPVS